VQDNNQKTLGPLANVSVRRAVNEDTSKALCPLAVAERHILGARYRSHLG
jgi:hypothetical protein